MKKFVYKCYSFRKAELLKVVQKSFIKVFGFSPFRSSIIDLVWYNDFIFDTEVRIIAFKVKNCCYKLYLCYPDYDAYLKIIPECYGGDYSFTVGFIGSSDMEDILFDVVCQS